MVDFGQIGELDEIGQSGFIALDDARRFKKSLGCF